MIFDCKKMVELREARKMTQEELATITGYTRQSIVLWERGKHSPKLGQIGIIGDALGVPGAYLIHDGE
jgi:transcriptional regulator with XRE-family HTH domain